MCHRYRAELRASQLAELLKIELSRLDSLPDGDLYPTYDVPVVRLTDDGRELVAMSWGLLPFWWKPGKGARSTFQRKTFNARCETIHEKPTFRAAFKTRRCVIPASEFYEGPTGHAAYFRLKDSPVMSFAGLWESCSIGGETVESCTIVTTSPNKLIGQCHHRMPVILDNVDRWLDPDIVEREPLEELFVPYDASRMEERPAE